MKRNVSVVCVCSAPNCCGTEQRSKYAGFGSEWDTLIYENTLLYVDINLHFLNYNFHDCYDFM
jgi:hypothetical protein